MHIGCYPIYEKDKYQWVAYVMTKSKRNWLKGEEGCSMSAFSTVDKAFESAINFCNKTYAKNK